MDHETLITLTSDIVCAHVGNNSVEGDALAGLIESVYSALAGAGTSAEEIEPQEPAVSVRSSVKPATLTCLDCGRKMKMLKRHLNTDHGLSPDAYRAKWGLPVDYPLVAPNYAAFRAELAKKIGLGRKPGAGRTAKAVAKAAPKSSARTARKPAPSPA